MPKKDVSKYPVYLKDQQVRCWFKNVARGSHLTAEITLRRLSKPCELLNTTPKGMVEKAEAMAFPSKSSNKV